MPLAAEQLAQRAARWMTAVLKDPATASDVTMSRLVVPDGASYATTYTLEFAGVTTTVSAPGYLVTVALGDHDPCGYVANEGHQELFAAARDVWHQRYVEDRAAVEDAIAADVRVSGRELE